VGASQAKPDAKCAERRASAAGLRTREGRDCDDSDEPQAPAATRHLDEEKIVHRDLAARGSVPTVAPSANPQPGVSPLAVGKSVGCSNGKPTGTAPAGGRDCDSDDDGVVTRAVDNPGVKRACDSSDPDAACGDRR